MLEKIKKLREKTQASIGEVKKSLEEAKGDLVKAEQILKQKGYRLAAQKKDRQVRAGRIASYVHNNSKIGVLVELACETDFVAESKLFAELAHNLALQIAAMAPKNKSTLLKQPFIKDEKTLIRDLISQHIAKFGENIEVKRFIRYQII